jgi:uncharacterized membrane protein YgcG
MDCPRCGAAWVTGHAGCGPCGFGLAAMMAAFGPDLIPFRRLWDEAHSLRVHEAKEVEVALVNFEEHFPQLFFAVYLGVLPPTLTVNELAFLLLNRGLFWAEHHPRLNEHAIALVLDPEARTAGLMVGYALEELLPPRVLERILRRVRTPLWHAEYAPAIIHVIEEVARTVRRGARRARRRDVLPPVAPEEFLGGGGTSRQAPDPSSSGGKDSPHNRFFP